MRYDLFQDRKGVHIKLTKDSHVGLRKILFEKGISMQMVFEEFAKRVIARDASAIKIVDNAIKIKLRTELNEHKRPLEHGLGELDNETMYDLISDEDIEVEVDE